MLFDFYCAKITKNITSYLKYIIKYNAHSIGIAYEGGLDHYGNPKDTRTEWQRHSLRVLVRALLMDYPEAKVAGHRDLSPDLNNNGEVEPMEWTKQCPCFEVKKEKW